MTKEERDALRLVNKIRRYEGRKALARLPKGDVGKEYSCPLARALNHGKVGVGDNLTIFATAKKRVKACQRAGLKMYDIDEEDDDGIRYFVMPDVFDAFVTWFDEQATKEAQHLARNPTRR